jgi:solute carrier family 13 (sodium-dependent dicarboxylate transporter), member 2/3/5
MNATKLTGLILGLCGFFLPLIITLPGLSFAGHLALGIFLLAAFFWMLEPIPIHGTSLLVIFLGVILLSAQGPLYKDASVPFVQPIQVEDQWILPSSALTSSSTIWMKSGNVWTEFDVEIIEQRGDMVVVAAALSDSWNIASDPGHRLVGYVPGRFNDYIGTLANPIIILFLGGFMLAEGAVKYNFDKNLTKYLLKPFGTKPGPILIGLMLVTASLSAFMSNTATTAMMMTVIIPIIAQLKPTDRFKTALALSIPIAANIGGIATPIGTPPNAIVIAALQQQQISLSFTEWMGLTMPLVVVVLGLAWLMLMKMFPPQIEDFRVGGDTKFDKSRRAYVFYGIFLVTVLLWVTESLHSISSSIIALIPIAGLALTEVLEVKDIRRLPWEVLWLVAGGLSLGLYMDHTGLATYMVSTIDWASFSGFAVIALFALVAVVMSNFLSNTVTATLLMPLAVSIGILQGSSSLDVLELALVIGVGTSLAMVLPISTPPNAIAMSTGMVKTPDMAKSGLVIGIVGILLMLAYALVYWPLLLN